MEGEFSRKAALETQVCPLCYATPVEAFCQDKRRLYFRCQQCHLVFISPSQFLSANEEKSRYDLHQNAPDDDGYRRFLNRLLLPLNERLALHAQGLDFGSGPGPTLHLMFEELGHLMKIYDLFYAKDISLFEKSYDFITATEVLEHLHQPQKELNRLWQCLKPGGWLGLMTKLVLNRERFSTWHYKNDLTHVCFFSKATFEWLAIQWQADLIFADTDVILLRKKPLLIEEGISKF